MSGGKFWVGRPAGGTAWAKNRGGQEVDLVQEVMEGAGWLGEERLSRQAEVVLVGGGFESNPR